MNSNAPIPPPTPYSCSHCGSGFDEPREFCPPCGAKLNARRDAKSWLTILWIVVLVLFALSAALIGACFTFFGVANSSQGELSSACWRWVPPRCAFGQSVGN